MSTAAKLERLNYRVPADEKSLTEQAAALRGVTVTSFIREAVRTRAEETLQEQGRIRLTNEQARAFLDALDNAADVNERLADLWTRPSVFSG